MDRGAWWAAVHGVARSRTRLSDFTFTFHFHALEKEMATHSSVLAWRIPWMAEPGGLSSLGSHRVGHDWSDLAAGEGKGGMIWEKSSETCILPYVKYIQSGFNAWNRALKAGALRWLWGMAWGGRWEGGSGWGAHVHPWLMHVNVWQNPLQHCKVSSN